MIPNDEQEQSRLDLVHHLWGLILRGDLHRAEFEKGVMEERAARGDPFRVLDLGTGTGIWAIDFGDVYPLAEVTGIDVSPIQVCSFFVGSGVVHGRGRANGEK